MNEEEYCYEMLRILRDRYEKDQKPYIDRLIAIKQRRTTRIIVTTNELDRLVFADAARKESQ